MAKMPSEIKVKLDESQMKEILAKCEEEKMNSLQRSGIVKYLSSMEIVAPYVRYVEGHMGTPWPSRNMW